VSSWGLKHDSLQDITSVLRGLRLIELAACKAAGKRKMDHERAMDFEAASGRIVLLFCSGPKFSFDFKG